jgi:hypothetical protein
MKLHFTISEFLVDTDAKDVPVHVVDKIIMHHIPIINPIRVAYGSPIFVSQNSGFRSYQWELDHGRSGTSQHTFGDGQEEKLKWKGAADYTCSNIYWLFEQLKKSDYTRVCIYPKENFIHCDFKGATKQAFESVNGQWKPL